MEKINLTVLNRMVKALNDQVARLELVQDDKKVSDEDFAVEVATTMGLATGVAMEATALVGDMTRGFSAAAAPKKNPDDLLNALLGGKLSKN